MTETFSNFLQSIYKIVMCLLNIGEAHDFLIGNMDGGLTKYRMIFFGSLRGIAKDHGPIRSLRGWYKARMHVKFLESFSSCQCILGVFFLFLF